MKIEAAPRVNLDTINALDADKRYFLSSTSGEIKEASWFMRIKCFFGVSSALAKVNNLVEAVKSSLLEAAGKTEDNVLEADIKTIDVSTNIKGTVLKDIAGRFRQANAGAVIRKEAEREARREAITGYMYVNRVNLACGAEENIVPIFRHAFKALVSGELPTKQDNGRTVLDTLAFSGRLKTVREDTVRLLQDIGNERRLGTPKIDRHYAHHILSTLFNEDGTRNGNTIDDLLPPDEAFAAKLFNLDEHILPNSARVREELISLKRDPVAYAKWIRGLCGGDKDLEDIVEFGLRNICVNGEGDLRADDAVEKKIAALRENVAEAREVEAKFPGFMAEFREAMFTLAGSAMPKGSVKAIAEAAERADVSKLAKLNSFSGPGSILVAVDQLRLALDKHANPWIIFADKADEVMLNGAEHVACHRLFEAVAVSKAGPAVRARIANAVRTLACRQAGFILETRLDEAESGIYTGAEKTARERLFRNEKATLNGLYIFFQPLDRPPESLDTDGITWEQAMAANDVFFSDVFDDHIAKAVAQAEA